MQEHNDLSAEIYDLLKDGRQLSISGVTRELKARNLNEHRLIVTGYLRALHDLDHLNEFDLSPSKIYTLKNTGNTGSFSKAGASGSLSSLSAPDASSASNASDASNTSGASNASGVSNASGTGISKKAAFGFSGFEIYSMVGEKTSKMTSAAVRLETAVYIFSTLFDRPCFESELGAAGIDSSQISRYFGYVDGAEQLVFKSKSDYKKYYDEIPSLTKGSPAYEIYSDKLDTDFLMRAVNLLNSLLKDAADISELVSKSGNKSLLDF